MLTAILLVGCYRKGSPCIEKGSSSLAKPPIAIDVIAPAVANQMAGERFVRVGEAGGWAFTLENPEDEVVLAMHGKNLEVKTKCRRGIGRGKLSRLAGVEEWPEQIVFLIRYDDGKPFKVLEGFNITGKQLNISGTSDGVMGSKVEKTEDAMKITIPGIILAGESEVNVQWIDYYRR
jgi:hypothetical protein